MNKNWLLGFILLSVLFLFCCAAGPNSAVNTVAADGTLAGFWLGLWHGMISPITFIISLFSDNVSFYEVHNNGHWYDLGFVLGAGILFGSKKTTTKIVEKTVYRDREHTSPLRGPYR